VQDRDVKDPSEADLRCVTKTKPRASDLADLLFAFKVCRYVKSNAIVIARKGTTVGLGMGQPSRVDSCLTAFRKAGTRARGAVLASDGFFPKPDSIALAKKHGIRAIVQPGGSIQDEAVIKACDRAKIAMVFTGLRHFKH
jgi:phosphoribosylaminoimidazolecarboxamide formyltransferase/IMP cyclohydrolase